MQISLDDYITIEDEEIKAKWLVTYKTITTCKDFKQIFCDEMDDIFPGGWKYENGEVAEDSTNGWYRALTNTCNKCGLANVLEFYDELEWYDSDIFDAMISDWLVRDN